MEVTKEELKDWYYSMTNAELCKKLGVSKITMIKLVKESGIKLKGKGGGFASKKVRVI